MRRILFIVSQPFFQWRGSPIRVDLDVRALAQLGGEVDLLTLPLGEDRTIPGVRIHRVSNWLRIRDMPIGPSLSKLWFDVFLFFAAWRLLRRQRYDVIHAVEDTGLIALWWGQWFKVPVVFEKHSDPSSYRKGRLRNALMRAYAAVEGICIRRAGAVIVTGPGLEQQALRLAPAQRVHHIPDIPSSFIEADAARTATLREQLLAEGGTCLATYVGSFAVYQGVDLMFEAIPEAVRLHPGMRVVVIGGSPEEIADRQRQLRGQQVEAFVRFPGKIAPDLLPDYLAASDLLLSPRLHGTNTPLKLLDYLKAGRGVVATDTTPNRLILDERVAVLTAPDPRAFAQGMVDLAQDSQRRERMGAAGQAFVREHYNFDVFKTKLAACYQGVTTL